MFKPKVSIFVKVWGVSVMVKQTCNPNLHFAPSVRKWLFQFNRCMSSCLAKVQLHVRGGVQLSWYPVLKNPRLILLVLDVVCICIRKDRNLFERSPVAVLFISPPPPPPTHLPPCSSFPDYDIHVKESVSPPFE